jgi:hypothetical protein
MLGLGGEFGAGSPTYRMGRYGTSDGIDAAIAGLAGRQFGVVSRAQLAAICLSERQVDRRLAAGRLIRLHPGVYAVGHHAPRREARWLAAVLACGDHAVLSHRSAGALWQIIDRQRRQPEVTVRARRKTPGITVHRGRLAPADLAVHRDIPVTSPARTLADLGPRPQPRGPRQGAARGSVPAPVGHRLDSRRCSSESARARCESSWKTRAMTSPLPSGLPGGPRDRQRPPARRLHDPALHPHRHHASPRPRRHADPGCSGTPLA